MRSALVGTVLATLFAGCAHPRRDPVPDADAALSLVLRSSEARQWAERTSQMPADCVRLIARIDREPQRPDDCWIVQLAESHETHLATVAWLRVYRNGDIRLEKD